MNPKKVPAEIPNVGTEDAVGDANNAGGGQKPDDFDEEDSNGDDNGDAGQATKNFDNQGKQ